MGGALLVPSDILGHSLLTYVLATYCGAKCTIPFSRFVNGTRRVRPDLCTHLQDTLGTFEASAHKRSKNLQLFVASQLSYRCMHRYMAAVLTGLPAVQPPSMERLSFPPSRAASSTRCSAHLPGLRQSTSAGSTHRNACRARSAMSTTASLQASLGCTVHARLQVHSCAHVVFSDTDSYVHPRVFLCAYAFSFAKSSPTKLADGLIRSSGPNKKDVFLIRKACTCSCESAPAACEFHLLSTLLEVWDDD